MRRTCASMASMAAMATRCLHARVVAAMEQGRATWLVRYAIAATSRGNGVRRAGGAWGMARFASRARHRRGDRRAATVEGTSPRTQNTHVSTFTSCKISAAEATSPWRSLSADSMRVSFARSASQYIFPSVTSQRVLRSSSLVASSSFTDVSSSCSRPWATIPVIATFDCDLRLASNCELAIK